MSSSQYIKIERRLNGHVLGSSAPLAITRPATLDELCKRFVSCYPTLAYEQSKLQIMTVLNGRHRVEVPEDFYKSMKEAGRLFFVDISKSIWFVAENDIENRDKWMEENAPKLVIESRWEDERRSFLVELANEGDFTTVNGLKKELHDLHFVSKRFSSVEDMQLFHGTRALEDDEILGEVDLPNGGLIELRRTDAAVKQEEQGNQGANQAPTATKVPRIVIDD